MISSMTAYVCDSSEQNWGILTWEIRSVNHRYLEISFRLPEQFRSMESEWRKLLMQKLSRGKVDFTLKFQPSDTSSMDLQINKNLLVQLGRFSQEMAAVFPNVHASVSDILSWPGILQTQAGNIDAMAGEATTLLNISLKHLQAVRQEEGRALQDYFAERIQQMHQHILKITSLQPKVIQQSNAKIRERFAELQVEFDQNRMEQELTWLIQKADVAEELKRLDVHVRECEQILAKGGVVGRRLDFLMQEMNREANTLASKSIDATVTHSAVELKVLIEQIREQVQNIE